MPDLHIPPGFARTTLELFGPSGQVWLDNLPAILSETAQRWSLEIQPPFSLSYNYVTPAVRADGAPVVLKLGFPNPELSSEIAALQAYDGRGAARLLEADPERGILLEERLEPGLPLSTLEDDAREVSIAASLLRQLWRPVPAESPFPTLARWTIGLKKLRPHFGGGCGPFPPALVDRAERLRDELLASPGDPVLLHGDFHYDNVLSARRQPWLAIDPKGVSGDRTYEPTPFFYNHLPESTAPRQLKALLARHIDQFAAELDLDRPRLLAWGLVQCVLSGWWCYTDHGHGWESVISIAGLLSELF
jgi:streptomycin 6-kinase